MEQGCLKKGIAEMRGTSQGCVREYPEAIRERYERSRRSSRKGKTRVLDKFNQATGYRRKTAIRVSRTEHGPPGLRRGRPPEYAPEPVKVPKQTGEVTDHSCRKGLKPFLPELAIMLVRQAKLEPAPKMAEQLGKNSARGIDRLPKPYRRRGVKWSFSTTEPVSLLKGAIPICAFPDCDEGGRGSVEVHLVAHCGESTEDRHLSNLCTVDMATGRVECQGVLGKRRDRVAAAVHEMSRRPLSSAGAGLGQRAASSSTSTCIAIAGEKASIPPVRGPTEKTIASIWSRGTGWW